MSSSAAWTALRIWGQTVSRQTLRRPLVELALGDAEPGELPPLLALDEPVLLELDLGGC